MGKRSRAWLFAVIPPACLTALGSCSVVTPSDRPADATTEPPPPGQDADAEVEAAIDDATTFDGDAALDVTTDTGPCRGLGVCTAIPGSSPVVVGPCGFDVDTERERCHAFCRGENPTAADAGCLGAGEFGQFVCSCPQ